MPSKGMCTKLPLLMRMCSFSRMILPLRRMTGWDTGIKSSVVATRTNNEYVRHVRIGFEKETLPVPCTGGTTLRVSRTTPSRNGSASIVSAWIAEEVDDAEEMLSRFEAADAGADIISARRRVWTSGYRERRWRHQVMVSAVESEPAKRKDDSWSRSCVSDKRLEGSLDRLDLTGGES